VTSATARTVRLELAYDGTCYHGWQVQPNATTIQGCLLEAARAVLGDPVRVTGASRTDAGVHALAQVVSLRTTGTLPAPALLRALNARLPRDIRVSEAAEARPGFDARRAARGKRYGYLLDNGAIAAPLALSMPGMSARRSTSRPCVRHSGRVAGATTSRPSARLPGAIASPRVSCARCGYSGAGAS
jgi:tRNA pseudouridine(38-40) synthase